MSTSVLLVPVPVTKSNIKDTVIKDGFYTAAQICTGAVRRTVRRRRHLLILRWHFLMFSGGF